MLCRSAAPIPTLLIAAAFVFGYALLSEPQPAASQSTPTVIFLTSGTSWTVPADWNPSNNKIECYGGGGSGGPLQHSTVGGGGGGGGAYSRVDNLNLAIGTNINYNVPGVGGNCYFNGTSISSASVSAQGGGSTGSSVGAAGGQAAAGIGTVRYSGGTGGSSANSASRRGGGGGGGAAGPNGDGGTGSNNVTNMFSGGGGGAGSGGSAGSGGTGGAAAGSAGFGGTGTTAGGPGGSGSVYGGAGGGGGAGGTGGSGAGGAPGIIVITYTPFVATTPTAPVISATTPAGGINLSWSAPSNGGSAITGYKIYRDTSSPATTLLNTITPATTYLDSTALTNTPYYYRVKATNAIGDSSFSNEVSATRPCSTTAPTASNVRGWAWSDTIGWISLSSADSGACTSQSYGLNINQSGVISGKMWSENIGWISADSADLTGCPVSPCTARMNGSAMQGWMKALAANQAEAAWDGWISLSGTSPAYGPTIATNGTISGYAWGDTTLGWISFSTAFSSATTTWVQCTPNYQCTTETTYDNLCTTDVVETDACTGGYICGGGSIACVIPPSPQGDGAAGNFKANPQLVAPGRTTNLTWDIRYATSCTVSEDNPNISDSWDTVEGSVTTSPIRLQTVYTLTCTGAGGNLTQTATVYQTPTWKEL